MTQVSTIRLLLSVGTLILTVFGTKPALAQSELKADRIFAEQKLKDEGFDPDFIRLLMSRYEEKNFASTLRLNILGILAPPRHADLATPEAVKLSRAFIAKNLSVLKRAEKEHGVPRDVLAALLWVETRHGGYTGKFHVPSVYVHMLAAGRPHVIDGLIDLAERTMDRSKFPADYQTKVEERAKKRAQWAIEELRSLEALTKSRRLDPRTLTGSFAGAFGIPQFIPSSYQRWAISSTGSSKVNLFLMPDAILSAAHYLKSHGWRAGKTDTYVPALLGYNNSLDYANSILKLAGMIRGR